MSVTAVHASETEEHDGALSDEIVGTVGAVPVDRRAVDCDRHDVQRRRVTEVTAWMANCHGGCTTPTEVEFTFPRYGPADHTFCLPPTVFDITR